MSAYSWWQLSYRATDEETDTHVRATVRFRCVRQAMQIDAEDVGDGLLSLLVPRGWRVSHVVVSPIPGLDAVMAGPTPMSGRPGTSPFPPDRDRREHDRPAPY